MWSLNFKTDRQINPYIQSLALRKNCWDFKPQRAEEGLKEGRKKKNKHQNTIEKSSRGGISKKVKIIFPSLK